MNKREIIVGFSGGLDSTALLVLLHQNSIACQAVHFEHGLRPESKEDANWCQKFCEERNIPIEIISLYMNSSEPGIEEKARELRLQYLKKYSLKKYVIFLAHHRDDLEETFFYRLSRGSNSTGLTGLRKIREIGCCEFMRPLLGIYKKELQEYLEGQKLSWRHDSTNDESFCKRNALRLELLPIWKNIFPDANLETVINHLQIDAEYIETEAENFLLRYENFLDKKTLLNMHSALIPRILRFWIKRETGQDILLSQKSIHYFLSELKKNHRGQVEFKLGGQITVSLKNDCLEIKKTQTTDYFYSWDIQQSSELSLCVIRKMLKIKQKKRTNKYDASSEGFSLKIFPKILTVRNWRAGDRMIPFGSSSPKKLSDLFTNAGISGDMRNQYPVILVGETIILVVGLRRAEFGRIMKNESEIMELSFEKL